MRKYRYNKKAGALQDALMNDEPPIHQQQDLSAPPPAAMRQANNRFDVLSIEEPSVQGAMAPQPLLQNRGGAGVAASRLAGGLDARTNPGWYSMSFYTVREGEQVLVTRRSGHCDVVVGPARVFRWWPPGAPGRACTSMGRSARPCVGGGRRGGPDRGERGGRGVRGER